jgi:hypothetical protein
MRRLAFGVFLHNRENSASIPYPSQSTGRGTSYKVKRNESKPEFRRGLRDCRWAGCLRPGLTLHSGDRRNLGRSERLRLTQRVADVRGLDHALSLELNPKTLLGTAASLRRS